ncbi:Unknown protein, partial [Striga hermonthica]
RARGSHIPPNPLAPRSTSLLSALVNEGFRELNIWYDGSTEPSRHLRSFENMAVLHRYNDPVQCRAFLTTLRGPAQDWFHQLPPGAVRDFDGFSSSFLNQFASVKAQEKSYLTLIGMQQKEGESLRDYVARYTRACVDVPSATEEIKSGGLTRGLLPGLCRNSLVKRLGRTFDEVLGRCAKYMNVKEAEADFLQAAKAKTESRDEKKDKKPITSGERKGSPKSEREGRSRGWRTTQYTPLLASNTRILERSKSPRKRARTPDKEELPQKRGIIYMIFGGPTDGDSNRARKAYARGRHGKIEMQQVEENGPVMNFGPANMGEVERPHNDALMITAQISGYEVQRIFVDTGSSVNVIFYNCLKRIELDIELAPLHTSLFGFNGSEVTPLEETMLVVVLGEDDLRKVKMVRFVVVDVESAYNVILGRPALNAFQA